MFAAIFICSALAFGAACHPLHDGKDMLVKRFTTPKVRLHDAHGYGEFGSPRVKGTHKGIDLLVSHTEDVYSNVSGKVTKIGKPYYIANAKTRKDIHTNSMRYVQVTDNNGLNHRFFYVSPSVKVGDKVKMFDKVGQCQHVSKYYRGMMNHVHYEVLKIVDKKEIVFNPRIFLGAELF